MDKQKIYGVIMAGGGGTRFWPLSRKKTPKQLLNLSGREIMVNEAADRLATLSGYENLFIVTNSSQAEKMASITCGRVLKNHILSEPSARNTAACIGYAAFEILKKYGDGVMIITPSDAYIRDEAAFSKTLEKAVSAAQETDGLITVGITPTFPATGYGYIKYGEGAGDAKPVEKFVEKPPKERAEQYLKEGNFVWNSGMFVWKASTILERFKKLLPDIYADLEKIACSFGTPEEPKVLSEIYPKIRSVSVDYGILEKSDDIFVVFGEFGWNDVGSWDVLGALHPADGDGNVKVGNVFSAESKNCVLYSGGRLVAVLGVDNLIVVETPDAVLVCPKDRAQDVKKITEGLASGGKEEYL